MGQSYLVTFWSLSGSQKIIGVFDTLLNACYHKLIIGTDQKRSSGADGAHLEVAVRPKSFVYTSSFQEKYNLFLTHTIY